MANEKRQKTMRELEPVPDFDQLDRGVLGYWEREQVFALLREQNAGGPTFSFLDGPLTANNPMGVHHGWGRTLKDAFQRYKALRGFDQRYQNGFDCQGLWVEVEVERELGVADKRQIESYGVESFAERCKERVARFAKRQTEQSLRLGQWMDFGNDYYTFSDTNNEYNWRFLKTLNERGLLYRGERVLSWCPRCGTSLSQHEQAGSYADLVHPSLFVRFPLVPLDAGVGEAGSLEDESLVVWTTTPWTLPANTAVAVSAEATYLRLATDRGVLVVAKERLQGLPFTGEVLAELRGRDLVGRRYLPPFADLEARRGVEPRVVASGDVSLEEGTGLVHVAPGCGPDDFELGRREGLKALSPLTEHGVFADGWGELSGLSYVEASEQVAAKLDEQGLLLRLSKVRHRYPVCWRCRHELVFRLGSEWFVAVEPLREKLREAARSVEWKPAHLGKRLDDWLANMGDWCVSRKRYFGLPLPFYPCRCGHVTVLGSRQELESRASEGLSELKELHRPWVDRVKIHCEACGEPGVSRVPDVGDVWLDAGVVPFSTLGFESPAHVSGGYATGAAKGLSGADLPAHDHFERWFPADFACEMREQVRLWFYATLFMSVVFTGRAPYKTVVGYERVVDEHGQKMSKTKASSLSLDETLEKLGADTLRWLYASQPLQSPLAFGLASGEKTRRKLLPFWNSAAFLVRYGNLRGFRPDYGDLAGDARPLGALGPLDRWLVARLCELRRAVTSGYEAYDAAAVTRELERFFDDLSTFWLRLSRERLRDEGDETGFKLLWLAVVEAARLAAPVAPFLSEELWRRLVAEPCPKAPRSVFLAGWPVVEDLSTEDADVLREVARVRLALELGRAARQQAGLRLRQPLRAAKVDGLEEATLKSFGEVLAGELNVQALEAGGPNEGWVTAEAHGLLVAVDPHLDAELEAAGKLADALHQVQRARKRAGLELGDPARLVVGASHPLLEVLDGNRDALLGVSVFELFKEEGDELRAEALTTGEAGRAKPSSALV